MKTYVLTFAALILLTFLTFGLSYLDLGAWSIVIAMVIATTKSALIALFFMHLVNHRVANRLAFAVAVGLAIFFIGISLLDVRTRDLASPEQARLNAIEAGGGAVGEPPPPPRIPPAAPPGESSRVNVPTRPNGGG